MMLEMTVCIVIGVVIGFALGFLGGCIYEARCRS
jgi:hypothetical protein